MPWEAALAQLEQLGLAWVAQQLLPASCQGNALLLRAQAGRLRQRRRHQHAWPWRLDP